MSRGPWKTKDEPPDYQPTSLLLLIAQRHDELAALDSKRAQMQGEIAELYRSAHRANKSDPQPASTRVA
jgi:hypothetical protein